MNTARSRTMNAKEESPRSTGLRQIILDDESSSLAIDLGDDASTTPEASLWQKWGREIVDVMYTKSQMAALGIQSTADHIKFVVGCILSSEAAVGIAYMQGAAGFSEAKGLTIGLPIAWALSGALTRLMMLSDPKMQPTMDDKGAIHIPVRKGELEGRFGVKIPNIQIQVVEPWGAPERSEDGRLVRRRLKTPTA